MSDARAEEPIPYRGLSILLHGQGETALTVLATTLARAEVGSFGWADCAGTQHPSDPAARRVLVDTGGAVAGPSVDVRELSPPSGAAAGIATWLVRDPVAAETAARLAAYLRLPAVLQRIVSRVTSQNARAVVVLTNIDALAGPELDHALGAVEVHETLHREGVTLIVTYRGSPSAILSAPFDRVYHVENDPGLPWRESTVQVERGGPGETTGTEWTLGDRVHEPAPLPAPSDPVGGIPPHRLR